MLSGDLMERYHAGRSVVWFWRQALIATTLTLLRDIRTHPFLAVRVLVVSWLAQWLLLSALRTPVRNLSSVVGRGIWNWTVENELDAIRELWFGGVGGPVFVTLLFVSTLTGWIIARLHRTQRAALVALYAASTPMFATVWLNYESSVARPTWSFLFIAIPALLAGLLAPQTRSLGASLRR
jgi:hypothetical protein